MANMRDAQRAAVNAAVSSVAKSLASPSGADTEYDRALVDLLSAVLGIRTSEAAGMILSPQSPLHFDS